MNITKRWKRFLAVSCSHASNADRVALDAIIKARDSFRPDLMVHLGDFTDTEAWLSSNPNGDGESVDEDITTGLKHLEELKCNLVLAGNHEARLWKHVESSNQIKAYAAAKAIEVIENGTRRIGAKFVKYKGVYSTYQIGNAILTHGTVYSENAARDMAEMYAKGNVSWVISGHTHRTAYAKGRRDDNPTGINVGTLTREGAMDYANTRRATLGWSQGFVWGEYTDTRTVAWLHEHPRNQKTWRLPF